MIAVAEAVGGWRGSHQINSKGGASYTNANRSSVGQRIAAHVDERFAPFERALAAAFHSCVRYYKTYNEHLYVERDTNFDLLRYEAGQEFKIHVDSVAGRAEADRQLAAVAYLNDNYTGGQIHFPRQLLKIKPESGDILLFPANFCYPHASLPVGRGAKYAVVTWFVPASRK